MRAVRIGYLSQCLLFLDANANGNADLLEDAQPTSAIGGVTLFPPSGDAATSAPLVQDAESEGSACSDSLTQRRTPNLLLLAAKGARPVACQVPWFCSGLLAAADAVAASSLAVLL